MEVIAKVSRVCDEEVKNEAFKFTVSIRNKQGCTYTEISIATLTRIMKEHKMNILLTFS